MALHAPKQEKKERILPPEGTHVARIYSLIEIGTVVGYQDKIQHKVDITFELPNETHVFNEEKGEQPFVISEKYTLSTYELAPFRKLIGSAEGKSLTDDEAEAYDAEQLLGKPLTITIEHKPKQDGGTKAKVTGTTPLIKGTEVPDQVNKSRLLTFDNFDKELFNSLPEWQQDEIKSSQQWKDKWKEAQKEDPNADEIPF